MVDFQPTRSVLYSTGLPDDLHFVRTENRSPFRFADVHAPSVCTLQIDFMTKKPVVTERSNSSANFAPSSLKYLVNRMTSYNVYLCNVSLRLTVRRHLCISFVALLRILVNLYIVFYAGIRSFKIYEEIFSLR